MRVLSLRFSGYESQCQEKQGVAVTKYIRVKIKSIKVLGSKTRVIVEITVTDGKTVAISIKTLIKGSVRIFNQSGCNQAELFL